MCHVVFYLFATVALLVARTTNAASLVWDGSQNTGTWSDIANWTPATPPVPGTGDTATFNNAGGTVDTLNLGGGVTINTVLFDTSSAAAFTIGSGAVGSQTLTLNDGGALTINATATNSQLVNANMVLGTTGSAQTITLTNNSTTGGQLLTIAGALAGSSGVGIKTLTVAGAGNTTISGAIGNGSGGGSVALTKSDAGTLVISGANTHSGLTTVQGGVLNIRNSTALGTTAAGTIVSSGAAIEIQSASSMSIGAEALTINGTGISSGGALRNISGTNSYGGGIALGSAARINSDAGTLTMSNNVTGPGGPHSLTVGGAGNLTFSGIIAAGIATLTKDGTGTVTLAGPNNNTLAGLITVSSGVLVLSKSNAGAGRNATAGNILVTGGTLRWDNLDQLPTTSQVTMTSGTVNVNFASVADEFSKLDLQGGAVAGLAGAQLNLGSNANDAIAIRGGVNVSVTLALTNASGGGLTFDATNNGTASLSNAFVLASSNKNVVVGDGSAYIDLEILGNVSELGGTYGFTKSGAGTLLLAGTSNSYQGATNIDQGRLLVNGTLTSGGAVTVANGATLGGSGTINRAVYINAGGTLAPGNSPDQIFTGALTLASSSIYEIEILGSTVGNGVTGYDQTVVTGAVALNDAVLSLIAVTGINLLDTFTIIDNDSTDTVSGTFVGLAEGAQFSHGVRLFSITYQGGVNNNDVVLTFLAIVPEPSSLTLLSGALLIVGAMARRKRVLHGAWLR